MRFLNRIKKNLINSSKGFSYIFICLLLLFGFFSCRKTIINLGGKLFVSADDFMENRPEGIFCKANNNTIPLADDGFLSFDKDYMHCVQISMPPNDFEIMRYESTFGPSVKHRDGATVMSVFLEHLGQCDVPWPSEFNWYNATMVFDGVIIPQLRLRKKGFLGSIFSPAPSLKVDVDYFNVVEAFGKTQNITLNNNSEDQTRLRSCINFYLFKKANYPAPQCNLANVSVNGFAMGAYSNLETVDHNFLLRYFGSDAGDLYEGQLADFEQDWLPRWDPKTDKTDPYRLPILALSDALDEPDEQLINALEKVLNIEQFITFWALEYILNHVDGYCAGRNNFFVYFNPNDQNRAWFIPWGMNYFTPPDSTKMDTVSIQNFVKAQIPRRLSRNADMRLKFENEVVRLLQTCWNEEELILLTERLASLVKTAQNNSEYEVRITELQDWIRNRPAEIESSLKNGLPQGAKRAPLKCFL